MVMSGHTLTAAVREFPELRALLMLREDTCWQFAARVDDQGDVASVHGVRIWPREWTDALGILDRTDAQAVRADPEGCAVWKREGGVVEVIEALCELPPPDARTAPRLVIGTAPPMLWTPGVGF
jgi:hypothetical protein